MLLSVEPISSCKSRAIFLRKPSSTKFRVSFLVQVSVIFCSISKCLLVKNPARLCSESITPINFPSTIMGTAISDLRLMSSTRYRLSFRVSFIIYGLKDFATDPTIPLPTGISNTLVMIKPSGFLGPKAAFCISIFLDSSKLYITQSSKFN